jgi:hypothetical protein
MIEPKFLLEILIIPLNPPAQLGTVHKLGQCRVGRQGRQPVLRRLPLARRPLDQEPLLGSGLMPQVIAMGLIALPVMALLLALGPVLLPEFRDPAAGRLDLRSAALSVAAVLAVIYGLKELAQDGPGWGPAVSIVAGLVLGAVFLYVGFNADDPGLPLLLFLMVIGVTVLGLLMVVMRALLRQATTLRTDMEAVI